MEAWADKSDTIDALAAALVKAMGEMTDVVKSQTANAGQYAYSYATLADAFKMARPILAGHGIAVTQTVGSEDDDVLIWTTLLHSSGQYVTHQPLRLPAGKTAQATGSALSYGKRYALMAALGLATEDDDGAAASPRVERHRVEAKPKKPAGPRTDEEGEIRAMLASVPSNAGAQIRGQFKAEFGCGLSDLDPSRHEEALDWVVGVVSEWEHNQQAVEA